jgi:glycosyltransferase involved in cell wall biosynthesis
MPSAAPSLTVIIPCYNAERWIDATLRSVLTQAWDGPLQVLVVDDGSRDGSAERVRRFGEPVRLLQQANAGVAAARNHGIREALGDWVAFVDADDIWLPGKLQAQWALLQAKPQAQMTYTAWHVWPSLQPEPEPALLADLAASADAEPARWAGPSGWIYPELLLDCEVWTSTVMARRELLQALGGFDAGLRIGEDYDLWLRASRRTPILRVPRPLALYRMHPSSLTKGAPDRNHQAAVVERALQAWGYAGPDGRRADPQRVRAALARTWRDFAGAHLSAGQVAQARRGSRAALRCEPASWRNWRLAAACLAASLRPQQARP